MTAVELIAAERARQVAVEGYSAGHDSEHDDESLGWAAAAYAMPSDLREIKREAVWPWDRGPGFKPAPDDRVRELVKAGALIVAEIERLQLASGVVAQEAE